jgi:hypothetical protein
MKELLLRRKLDEIDDYLVQKATELVERTGIAGKRNGKEIMQDKQLRNVIAVAQDTQSIPVVDNFIKYQIGRHEEWRHQGFGEQLLQDLRSLQAQAQNLADQTVPEGDLAIHGARRYLGYLMRHFKYRQEVG